MTTEFFAEHLEDQREAWKADHDKAMECRDLEDLIRRGLGLFHIIRLADESWSRKVQAGTQKFNADAARGINAAYKWWLEPCDDVLKAIRQMELSLPVEGAGEFLRCYRLAKNLAGIAVDDLIESVEQVTRGEAVELTEEDWGGSPSSQVA
jgi:hypothetical protein